MNKAEDFGGVENSKFENNSKFDIMTAPSAQEEHKEKQESLVENKQQQISEKIVKSSYGHDENRQQQKQISDEKLIKSYGDSDENSKFENSKFENSKFDENNSKFEKCIEEEELDMDENFDQSDINPSDLLKQTMHGGNDLEVRIDFLIFLKLYFFDIFGKNQVF